MSEIRYTARFTGPHLIERGRDSLLSCPVYLAGTLTAPASGTVTIRDNAYTAIVSAAAVTIAGSIANYTVTAGTTSGLQLEEGWTVEWVLTISGSVEVFHNTAHLVRKKLRPTLGLDDLYARHRTLDPSVSTTCIHSLTVSQLQEKVDSAFVELENEIYGMGQFPARIPDPTSIRKAHLALALQRIFSDFATGLNADYRDTANSYRAEYTEAMRTLRWNVEQTDDNPSPNMNVRKGVLPGGIYLASRGRF